MPLCVCCLASSSSSSSSSSLPPCLLRLRVCLPRLAWPRLASLLLLLFFSSLLFSFQVTCFALLLGSQVKLVRSFPSSLLLLLLPVLGVPSQVSVSVKQVGHRHPVSESLRLAHPHHPTPTSADAIETASSRGLQIGERGRQGRVESSRGHARENNKVNKWLDSRQEPVGGQLNYKLLD